MKRIILCLLSVVMYMGVHAQDVQFVVLPSTQDNLPADVSEALGLKLKQILTRNSAASANAYNVFGIEPVLEIEESLASEGLMQQVFLAKGELTLLVKNLVDGSLYHSLSMPVTGSAEGNEEKAMKAMVTGIKTTNKTFTSFIRVARQKIQDYYAANCGIILQKAQTLYEQQKYQEAVSYLSAVSEVLPCYEQASVLLAELAQYVPVGGDTVIVERVVEKPVVVEKVVETPVVVEKVVEKPVVVEKVVEKPVPQEKSPELDCQISISVNDLDVKVLRCYGNETQRRITIELEILNRNNDITKGTASFNTAYTLDGVECNKRGALGDRFDVVYGVKFPSQIKLKQNYFVLEVSEKIPGFSYVEFEIRGAEIVIRNLPVEW